MPWSSIGVLSRINVAKCLLERAGISHHISCYQKAIIIYDGSDITRPEGDDQLGRPRGTLGFPLEVLGKPAVTRLNHCP